jgi:hypothetical protein
MMQLMQPYTICLALLAWSAAVTAFAPLGARSLPSANCNLVRTPTRQGVQMHFEEALLDVKLETGQLQAQRYIASNRFKGVHESQLQCSHNAATLLQHTHLLMCMLLLLQ